MYTIENIKNILSQDPDRKIIYFWGHTPNPKKMTAACLSQWYDCSFEVNDTKYHTAEQFMMANKALLFDDQKIYLEIMASDHPHDYKKLGRMIKGFNSELWDARKYDIVVEGNKAKFGQNPELKVFLLSTGNAILVEASPYDRIWGIGLDKETAMKGTVDQWNGKNLLGCALMDVRDWLSANIK